ncbi:MAG: phosphoenolpyruvate--protein phosphotransferase [Planctomycetes bacterium]|nr:phosphoenolpyruvate--protein phosphotransferase [Planctomycetota bacterium]
MRLIQGTSVSPGLALAPVYVVRASPAEVPTWSVPGDEVEREIERLERALVEARDELSARQKVVATQAGEKDAEIFGVHRMILSDPGALTQVKRTIREERINSEAAVQALIRRMEQMLGKLEGNSVRNHAADLSDPWRYVLDALMRVERETLAAGGSQVILAAAELTPAVMTSLPRERLLGVITETGGRFSHGAVLARSLGVPCVVGLPQLLGRLEQGLLVAVDGERGSVQLRPGDDDVRDFEQRRSRLEARRGVFAKVAAEPARSADGHRFGVQVNIESLHDFDTFDRTHTDGIGLLRTEFLYLERPQFPSEDEQFRLYRRVMERMEGQVVTLRTLDIGGDKRLPYFKTPAEPNPALGWRGIRITLQWQDLMRVQLRAALRAGAGKPLRILLPMISSIEEVLQTRKIFDSARESLVEQGHDVEREVPVGMMVEVPSVVFTLPDMLKHVDFLSVGTNDLVQYLLAADRDNPWVARLYEPQHPAVVRALASVARDANAAGKPVSVCGDIADDPAIVLMLLGMGYDSVSVAPHFVAEIKHALRRTTRDEARALAHTLLECTDCDSVRRVLTAARERLHAD